MVSFAVARVKRNPAALKDLLMSNPFIQMLEVTDADGHVDVEGIMSDLKPLVQSKGKVTISLPLLGDMTFHPGDVDALYTHILAAANGMM